MLATTIVALAGCGVLRTWDAHTTTTSSPAPLDVTTLVGEPVATLGVVASGGLGGHRPVLAHALAAALAEGLPSVPAQSIPETLNALNEHGLAAEYAELLSLFVRTGVLERGRLRALGAALRCRYVLLPGIAGLDEILIDQFEVSGLKLLRSRVTTLRLWLQIWDARTGRMLWESAGEARMATELLRADRTVPFENTARMLWLRMLREGLLGERTGPVERRFR